MQTAKIDYQGELRCQLQHLASGETIVTDAPVDNMGKGAAFSPTDLLSSSLAACMFTIMGIYARQSNTSLDGSSCMMTKVMTSTPKRMVKEIHVSFTIKTTNTNAVFLENLKKAALNCPVALSLHPDIKQVVAFDFEQV
jgi:putative redox protein